LAFHTNSDLFGWDQNVADDIYLFDRRDLSLGLASVTPDGQSHNGPGSSSPYPVYQPALSGDGTMLVFRTTATNLGPLPACIVLKRLDTGAVEVVSVDPTGAPIEGYSPSISGNGRFVAFMGLPHYVYLRDRWYPGPARYCEAKLSSQGCAPVIGSVGSPSVGDADDFHITASQVIASSPGILFWGTSPDFAPFGGGTRCVRSPLVRTAVQVSGGTAGSTCAGTYGFHFTHAYMAGFLLGPGATLYAQYWQRDAAHPDGTGRGLTDALQFTITP
jgi:hypothetical protein